MASFHPVPLPASLVEARRLGLERDIFFQHLDWCFSPAGNLHVYSEVFYNANRYQDADGLNDQEVEKHHYYSFLVSVYDRGYHLLRQVPLDEVGGDVQVEVNMDWGSSFTALPGGLCVVAMSSNRCRVYDESLGSCVNAYTVGEEEVSQPEAFYRRGLARQISPCPDGRLLCVLSELNAGIQPNLLAISERPYPDLRGKRQPTLRYLAWLQDGYCEREPHPIPYLRLPDGEPPSLLEKVRLPAPLRRLYAFAGRWTRQHPDVQEQTGIFSVQEHLRPLDRLEGTPDGKLVFLDENQGNWTSATLPEGDDPPVWVEDVFDGYGQGQWGLVSDSLSRLLVTFCLQELLFGSRCCLHDESCMRLFEASRAQAAPLWLGGPYPYWDEKFSFHLWRGSVLVGQLHGGFWLGANDGEGIRFLTAHQGPIREVGLALHSSWSLSISPNGSAEISLPNWSDSAARVPAGTFDFAAVRDQLLAACSEGGGGGSRWYGWFPRSGQTSTRGLALYDTKLARGLFRRALASVASQEASFDELTRKFPPPL